MFQFTAKAPLTRSPLRPRLAILFRKTLALLLCMNLALPLHSTATLVPASKQATASLDLAERERRLNQTMAAIADMRNTLDRTEFDTEAVLESLDYDPEAIIDFVRHEIRFEPYEGLLRGIQGTLMGRAGNALDQSLLLAFLLRGSGADARLAYGTLNDAQATQLVQSLYGQQTPPVVLDVSPALRKAFETFARTISDDDQLIHSVMQQLDSNPSLQDETLWTAAEQGRDYLLRHLHKAGLSLKPINLEPQLAEQSRNYYWVEYRDALADPWQRIHAIPAGDPFDEEKLATAGYIADDIPEQLQHRLRLSAKMERQVGGTKEIIDLMSPWERPVANMVGKRLSFSNHPDGLTSLQDMDDLSIAEARTTLLIPMLNGAPAPGAQAFDVRGRTISLDALKLDSIGASKFFQTMGNQSQEAAEALTGLSFGSPKAEPNAPIYSLTRVWLEYTSIHPNGTQRVDQRTIWQAPTSASQSAPAMLWELTAQHGIGVAVSEQPQSYLLDAELARIQEMEPLLRWVLAKQHGIENQAMPNIRLDWSSKPELSYLSQFDAGIDTNTTSLLAYRAEPSIVITHQGRKRANEQITTYAGIDVIHNRRTILRTDESLLRTAPIQALQLGAWETLIEQAGLTAQHKQWSQNDITSADAVFPSRMHQDPVRRQQAPIILQSPKDLSSLPDASLPGTTLHALEEDLRRGYIVALEPPSSSVPPAWWRVSLQTGETLGRGSDGRGEALLEYAVWQEVTAAVLPALFVGGASFAMCLELSSCSAAQCAATTAIMGTGTAAVGFGLGIASALAAGLLGVALNVSSALSPAFGTPSLPSCIEF